MATKTATKPTRTRARLSVLPSTAPASAAKPVERTDREGKQMLGGFIGRPAHKQFRVLATELDMTHVELLREALNDLFIKHGRPPIA